MMQKETNRSEHDETTPKKVQWRNAILPIFYFARLTHSSVLLGSKHRQWRYSTRQMRRFSPDRIGWPRIERWHSWNAFMKVCNIIVSTMWIGFVLGKRLSMMIPCLSVADNTKRTDRLNRWQSNLVGRLDYCWIPLHRTLGGGWGITSLFGGREGCHCRQSIICMICMMMTVNTSLYTGMEFGWHDKKRVVVNGCILEWEALSCKLRQEAGCGSRFINSRRSGGQLESVGRQSFWKRLSRERR